MKKLLFLLGFLPLIANAQSSSLWKYTGTLKPNVNTWTLTVPQLSNCSGLQTNGSGLFSCSGGSSGGGGGTNSGNVLTLGDARYVKKSGDTMTGTLNLPKAVITENLGSEMIVDGGFVGETQYVVTTANVSISPDRFTISPDPGWSVGDIIHYSNGGGATIGGMVDGGFYYVIGNAAGVITFSTTSGGGALNMTTTGNNAQIFTRVSWFAGTAGVTGNIAGWKLVNGRAEKQVAGTAQLRPATALSITAGKTYKVQYTVSNWTVAGTTVVLGGVTGQNNTQPSADGTYSTYITAQANTSLFFVPLTGMRADIDNVSVREVVSKVASTGMTLVFENSLTSATANEAAFVMSNTVNKTDGDSDLLVLTSEETSAPGTDYLLRCFMGGTQRCSISNGGAMVLASSLSAAAISGTTGTFSSTVISRGVLTGSSLVVSGNAAITGTLILGRGATAKPGTLRMFATGGGNYMQIIGAGSTRWETTIVGAATGIWNWASGYSVGIGTTAPKATLDVVGGISGTTLSIASNANITGSLLVKGNVGVGTTAPKSKLDVVGTISGSKLVVNGSGSFNMTSPTASGVTITGIPAQSSPYMAFRNSAGFTKLQVDRSGYIQSISGVTVVSRPGMGSFGGDFIFTIKRDGSNNNGNGTFLKFTDNNTNAYIKWISNSNSQGVMDLEFHNANGLNMSMPSAGGIYVYNPVQNSSDISIIKVPRQTLYPGGGTWPVQATFKFDPMTFAGTSPLTVTRAVQLYIASAPLTGINMTIGKSTVAQFDTGGSNKRGLIIRGGNSQSGALMEFTNTGHTILSAFTASGYLAVGGDRLKTGLHLEVFGAMSGSRLTVSGNANITGSLLVKGNVGVGTTAPKAKLDVQGTVSGSTIVSTLRSPQRICFGTASGSALSAGSGVLSAVTIPGTMSGFNLINARLTSETLGVTTPTRIKLFNKTKARRQLLSTAISMDSLEDDSRTAATPFVIDTAADDVSGGDKIVPYVVTVGSPAPSGISLCADFANP